MADLLEFLRVHEESFRSQTRLQSLYSDFRLQRDTNPENYTANSTAWLRALSAASRAGLLSLRQKNTTHASHLAFSSGPDLASRLDSARFGRPLALDAVVGDAIARGELWPLREFLERRGTVYAGRGWGARVPSLGQVVGWGVKAVGLGSLLSLVGGDRLAVGEFVVLANVEEAGAAVANRAAQESASLTSRIFSRQLFESTFANALGDTDDMKLSPTDMTILLTYLSRDKPLLSLSADGQTIKLKSPSESTPTPVTHEDTNIASLRTLISSMTAQTDALTSRIAHLDATVRTAIRNKQSLSAKSALRSKKLAETTLSERLATLAQLEEVFTQIETAADQVSVVRVLEGSSAVLASLHEEVGGVEGVEGVVERLREEMDKVDEVGSAINEASAAGKIDENEVDEELEALERAEREKVEAREAEETRIRLEELERVEKEAAAAREEAEQKAMDEGVKNKESSDAVMEDARPSPELA